MVPPSSKIKVQSSMLTTNSFKVQASIIGQLKIYSISLIYDIFPERTLFLPKSPIGSTKTPYLMIAIAQGGFGRLIAQIRLVGGACGGGTLAAGRCEGDVFVATGSPMKADFAIGARRSLSVSALLLIFRHRRICISSQRTRRVSESILVTFIIRHTLFLT